MTHDCRPLTFETMVRDPLVHAVMRSDGVTMAELLAVLAVARAGVVARERQAVRLALAVAGAPVAPPPPPP